jgi:hypothetical protein
MLFNFLFIVADFISIESISSVVPPKMNLSIEYTILSLCVLQIAIHKFT